MTNQPPIESMLPISDASKRYHRSPSQLQSDISSGKIRAAKHGGEILLFESDLMAELPKVQRPEYIKYAHLKGVGISVRAAGRKYSIPSDTLSEWSKKGYISTIGFVGNKKMLDEADVAYCAEVYSANKGQGKWIFNPDGTPYRHKN
jgi:hypothetical protein